MSRITLAMIAVTAAVGLSVAAPALAHSGDTPQVTERTLKIEELGPKYLLHRSATQLSPERASKIEQLGPKNCLVGRASIRCWVERNIVRV
jgi:hypothetical protein